MTLQWNSIFCQFSWKLNTSYHNYADNFVNAVFFNEIDRLASYSLPLNIVIYLRYNIILYEEFASNPSIVNQFL